MVHAPGFDLDEFRLDLGMRAVDEIYLDFAVVAVEVQFGGFQRVVVSLDGF